MQWAYQRGAKFSTTVKKGCAKPFTNFIPRILVEDTNASLFGTDHQIVDDACFHEPVAKSFCQLFAPVLYYVQCFPHICLWTQLSNIPAQIPHNSAAVGIERKDNLSGQVVFVKP